MYTSASRGTRTSLKKVTTAVEILTHLVTRIRLAVANVAAAVRERQHEAADFGGEWMVISISSRVQPQDLSRGADRRQRMQHSQDRSCPDPCAEQHHRPLPALQNEASTRRAGYRGSSVWVATSDRDAAIRCADLRSQGSRVARSLREGPATALPCQRPRRGTMRYRRNCPSDLEDVRARPSFFLTVPARKPRTLCCCQSVASIISGMVAPMC
jgi:hypothetical protein